MPEVNKVFFSSILFGRERRGRHPNRIALACQLSIKESRSWEFVFWVFGGGVIKRDVCLGEKEEADTQTDLPLP